MWILAEFVRNAVETPYGSIFDLGPMSLLISILCGALLFGTAGAALLTGKYQEHRSTLAWNWYALGFLTIFFFCWASQRRYLLNELRNYGYSYGSG